MFGPSGRDFGADGAGCGFVAGIAHGIAGAGLFVESGARVAPDGTTSFIATAGVSLRLPAVLGIAVDLCAGLR